MMEMISYSQLQHAWWIYPAIAVGYTVIVCALCCDVIIAKRNNELRRQFIWTHLAFLIILMVLFWFSIHIFPSLPSWLTEEHYRYGRASGSEYQSFCEIIAIVFPIIESRYIRKRLATDTSGPNDIAT